MGGFYECAAVPACALGTGGAPWVGVDYGATSFECPAATHAWHRVPGEAMTYLNRRLGGLCPTHACERVHAEPPPAPRPTPPVYEHSESAAQAALRARFAEQQRSITLALDGDVATVAVGSLSEP